MRAPQDRGGLQGATAKRVRFYPASSLKMSVTAKPVRWRTTRCPA